MERYEIEEFKAYEAEARRMAESPVTLFEWALVVLVLFVLIGAYLF